MYRGIDRLLIRTLFEGQAVATINVFSFWMVCFKDTLHIFFSKNASGQKITVSVFLTSNFLNMFFHPSPPPPP